MDGGYWDFAGIGDGHRPCYSGEHVTHPREQLMSRIKIAALSLLVGLGGLVGCASNPGGGGDDTMGDDAPPFTNGVSTLTGSGEPGFVDGKRGAARFANPVHCAVGPDGKVYVADFDNGKIRVVDADGTTGTVIAQDKFRRPFGMAFIGSTLYVGTDNNTLGAHDIDSGTVWKVNVSGKSATVVAENIGRARGLTALSDGRLALTDYQRHVVKTLDPNSGAISLLAGTENTKGMVDATGTAALFAQPYHLVQRADGKLIVVDYENNRLRLVDLQGNVTTYAGTGTAGNADGPVASATFNKPQGIMMTSNGDIFVTDLGNYTVRRIRGDVVTTIAGNGSAGYLDHDTNLSAQFYGLEGICGKADGSMLYVSDGGRGEDLPYNYIRQIKL